MNILYIANIRLPTEKAHGAQIMKMCEAFVRVGADVELLVPTRRNIIADDPFEYYGVTEKFKITTIRVPDTVALGRIGFLLHHGIFSLRAAWYARRRKVRPDVVYAREMLALLFLGKLKARSVWETHDNTPNKIRIYFARTLPRLVAISSGLRAWWIAQGIEPHRIMVAHDGVDLRAFANPESREIARRRLGLPLDAKIALYIGKLGGWKGIETLFAAASELHPDIMVAAIGGDGALVAKLRKEYPAVRFLGFRPYRELADNQGAGDVLVLPNTGNHQTSAYFTSPLKLFTYMASGVPIVASDVPSIREVLGEDTAYLVCPDDSAALAASIRDAMRDVRESGNRATAAQREVVRYSWESRARSIVSFANLTNIYL